MSERLVLTVVVFLGVALLGDLTAIAVLAYDARTIPDVLVATAGGLSGSLGTLLVAQGLPATGRRRRSSV